MTKICDVCKVELHYKQKIGYNSIRLVAYAGIDYNKLTKLGLKKRKIDMCYKCIKKVFGKT